MDSELRKFQTYLKYHRFATYSIVAFIIFLTFLLVSISKQVSQQALTTSSQAYTAFQDRVTPTPSANDICEAKLHAKYPCVGGTGGDDPVEGQPQCMRNFNIYCKDDAKRVIPPQYAQYCSFSGAGPAEPNGVTCRFPDAMCDSNSRCNEENFRLAAEFCGCAGPMPTSVGPIPTSALPMPTYVFPIPTGTIRRITVYPSLVPTIELMCGAGGQTCGAGRTSCCAGLSCVAEDGDYFCR